MRNGNWIGEVESFTNIGRFSYRICMDYGKTLQKNGTYGNEDSVIEVATEKQIAHLKACIAADKYVEWNENMLIPQYEIY